MIKVQEQLNANGIMVKGNAQDVLAYLERESQRCPKMTALQYIRLRRLEQSESKQFGQDVRGIANARRF